MNQVKIGRFIAERRKNANLTQMQLAEKLNITDRAVSKWETGKSLPDASIMLELCDVLKITVNDLLSGEIVTMDNYSKETETNLLEILKQKQEADKRLLRMEFLAGIMASIPLAIGIVIGLFVPMEEWKQVVIVLSGMVPLLVAIPFLLRIEQVAGFYECRHCHHQYVPEYKSVFIAPHIGRTRYMKCPQCKKVSWQKKVLSKD
ncbi:MAG: helix-turn-helix transcriptional regulator [Clostridia bacterium]|nr:helix-turn-helix transcriptional regulator [Clostridia bacterium]